jgi:hypothetical protein
MMADTAKNARIGIIAGSGMMPISVATAAAAAGRPVHLIALEDAADDEVENFPHTWVNIGEIGRILKVLKKEQCEDLVIIGGVRRPKMDDLRMDLGTLTNLPALLSALVGGDNSVLSSIVEFFEKKGFCVVGAHDIAPDLLASGGPMGRKRPSNQDNTDIGMAIELINAMGRFDVGQAVVVARGHVLAVEAAEGTDALLERCASVKRWSPKWGKEKSGVLIKCAKPGQERRVDLPAIGPETVRRASEARLNGIAIATGDVLIAERAGVIEEADKLGLFVVGVAAGASQ